MRILQVILNLPLLCYPAAVLSTVYSNFLDEGAWQVDASVFECRLTQSLPFYGEAVFQNRAGETSRFFLNAKTSRLKSGQASLVAEAPLWKPKLGRMDLGHIYVKQGLQPIRLPTVKAERMLAELNGGKQITITRRPWYGAETSSKLAITSISFRPAYRKYLDCLAGLLPVNFDQIKRTSIYFGSGQHEELMPSEQRKLDHIIQYVQADPKVKEFYIDGHTDSVGDRGENLELSKKRAELVTAYLTKRGFPPDAIVTRWHGERYPVATNQSRKGRSQNRRVTLRLERIDVTKIPPVAMAGK